MPVYPGAIWKPVPNFGYPPGTHGQLKANGPRRAFFHDNQGWRNGAYSTFCDPKRGSAHININLDGPPWQFVDLDDAAWHAGGYLSGGLHEFANLFCWGFEYEGGYPTPTPITDYQIKVTLDICRWLAQHYGFTWQAVRRVDLWEHREVYPTSCPSDRIRWPEIIAALKEQPMDWKAAKLELINDHQNEDAAFWDWLDTFPETQEQKDNAQRQNLENTRYRAFTQARKKFFNKQVAWRS